MNERIREIHGRLYRDAVTFELLCECAGNGCSARITVPVTVYESVRQESGRYLVALGHESGLDELVASSPDGYGIVAAVPVATPAA